MRTILFCALIAGLCSSPRAEKPVFELYGFARGDMYYATNGVLSFGKPSLLAINQATGSDTAAYSFSAEETRFGFKGSGAFDSIALGGLIELDFFVNTSTFSARPRMRLAYAWCKPVPDLELRFGQQWDVFSPLNPMIINLLANLWLDGNYGYRRPMIELRYEKNVGSFTPSVQLSIGEAKAENDLTVVQDTALNATLGTFIGPDNFGFPLVQGRIALGCLGKAEFGASAAYASFGTPKEFAAFGWALDADVPLNKVLSLRSEFGTGTNLNNANFQSAGGDRVTSDVKTYAVWTDAIVKPWKFFMASLGFGREGVTSTVAAGKVTSNMTVWSDLNFPLGDCFAIGVEYQWLRTTLGGAADDRDAQVIDFVGVVNF